MRVFYALLAMTLAVAAMGDIVKLKDGTRLEGDVKKSDGGWRVVGADGKSTYIESDRVASIEVTSRGAVPATDMAQSALISLRRSVQYLGDSKQVISRYEKFIEQYPKTPAAAEAEKDLATWRERDEKGVVKYGGRWVTAEERSELQERTLGTVDQARQLMKQGRMKEADPLLQQVLAEDPQNVAALYLKGVMQFRQDQFPAARKSFETAMAALGDHAPTLNNLAVILWRQNQQAAALKLYERAMQAAPMQRIILDNVAEAFAAMAPEMRDGVPAKSAWRTFSGQDSQLQAKMAGAGLYRYGGTWLSQVELDRVKAAEKDIKDKLDAMSKDFDAAQARVQKIADDMDSNDRLMRQMEANSWTRDVDGKIYQVPLPVNYYQLARDNDKLKLDKAAAIKKLDDLRLAAKVVQQQLPVPRFSGVQQIIGVEGAPLPAMNSAQPAPLPTTLPATAPTTEPTPAVATTEPAAAPTSGPTTEPTNPIATTQPSPATAPATAPVAVP